MSPRRRGVVAVLLVIAVAVTAGSAYALTFGADLRMQGPGGRRIGIMIPGIRAGAAVAALVNGDPIYWSEVDQQVGRVALQYGIDLNTEEGKKQRAEITTFVLDQLIDQRLILQEARRRSIEVTEAEIDAEIERIKQNVGSEEQFQAILAQRNLTIADVRALLRPALTARKLRGVVASVQVTDAEIAARFAAKRKEYDRPEQAHVSHILIRVESPDRQEFARKQILFIQARLRQGAKFTDMARQYSQDPGSKERGGDLGFVNRGTLVPEFEKVAYSMKPGEISGPVKSSFGYHLILLHERRAAVQATLESVKEQIRQQITEEKQEAAFQVWLRAERKRATIKRVDRPTS